MSKVIATIDFEMTALSYDADMIEAGVALWEPGEPIKTWSSLIRPKPDCLWNEESAEIHHITRDELESAPGPAVVAARLNRLTAGIGIAYCNALAYDQVWFRNLFRQADLEPVFYLADMWSMPGLDHAEHALRMFYWFNKVKLSRHRAGPISEFLLTGYAFAMGFEPQVVALQ